MSIKIILAPMHGYTDAPMRDLLTQIGGFDEVVSEFVRITHTLHSRKTWLKRIPELANNGKTANGTLCSVQLLGSDPICMAENAAMAIANGAKKIDLNFGCPAPTVNKHQGGAALLDNPELMFRITHKVRQSLPENIPLTAKMRLGISDTEKTLDCARALSDANIAELTVHARTKIQQYNPPAQWQWFAPIQEVIKIPLIANGDIFSVQDFNRLCQEITLSGIMLGRGILRKPDLALQIRANLKQQTIKPLSYTDIMQILQKFFRQTIDYSPNNQQYPIARIKQWLAVLKQEYCQLQPLFNSVSKLTTIDDIEQTLLTFTP